MKTRETSPNQSSDTMRGKKSYEVNGASVSVSWKIFNPSEKSHLEANNDSRAVIFIPGYSITERARSIESLCQTFSDRTGSPTYSINTRADQIQPGSLATEAEAVQRFIKERGLKSVTLVGNSQGGAEAIHLTALLQELSPDVNIDGLILLDSVSLYRQKGSELLRTYVTDIANTAIGMRKPLRERKTDILLQNAKYAADGITGVLKGIFQSKTHWFERTLSEIRNMSFANPDLGKIKAPVIIVQGAIDIISDPRKIIPPQNEEDVKKGYIQGIAEREEFLKANVFPNSNRVRMVVVEEMGYHNVSYSTPESVVKVALDALERTRR